LWYRHIVNTTGTARKVLVAALALHLLLVANAVRQSSEPQFDFDRYWTIASTPGTPYRDFQVEHPIGTLLLFRTLAATTGSRNGFALGVVLINAVADMTIIAALVWGWGPAAGAAFAVTVLPIAALLLDRIDLWSMAAATVAVAAWKRERNLLAGASLALGAAFKLWPLMFGVLFAATWWRRRSARALASLLSMTAVSSVLLVVWWILAGWHGMYEVLTFRGATGWQIESTVGSVIHLVTRYPVRLEQDSWRIGTLVGPVTILMFVIAMPVCFWSVWRGGTRGHVGAGWLAGVSALLLLSALLSAQFAGWLLPGAAMSWVEGNRRSAALAWIAAALTGLFMAMYGSVVDGTLGAVLVVLRNVVLAVLCVSALVALRETAA
jgi:hypothetical protein